MTIARQIETVAVGVYIYAQPNDKGALGMLGLVQALPVILLAIPGGQLADRVDRRLVLACDARIDRLGRCRPEYRVLLSSPHLLDIPG